MKRLLLVVAGRVLLYVALLMLGLASVGHSEVTFTFDDGWKSDVTKALPVLDRYGFKGTAYIITSFAGHDARYMDWGEIHTLALHGWDIEDHTYSHKDLTAISVAQARRELDKSLYDLRWHGYAARHFAPPFGELNPKTLELVRNRFVSSRAAWVKSNELNPEAKLDRYNLSVLPLNEKTDEWLIERCIEHATFEKRWLIFMVHRVVDDPAECNDQYCISRAKLAKIVKYTVDQGAKVVTVDQYFKNSGVER